MIRAENCSIFFGAFTAKNLSALNCASLALDEDVIEGARRICIHKLSLQPSRKGKFRLGTVCVGVRRNISPIDEITIGLGVWLCVKVANYKDDVLRKVGNLVHPEKHLFSLEQAHVVVVN